MKADKVVIIDDSTISINDRKYKCKFTDDHTINIESRLLGDAIFKDVSEFLSKKDITIDVCEELDLRMACNVKESKITVKKAMIYYHSDYFEYDPDTNALTETDLDCEFGNGTILNVETYYMYYGLEWSMSRDKLEHMIEYLSSHDVDEDEKIEFNHSGKLIGMDNCLENCFKSQTN